MLMKFLKNISWNFYVWRLQVLLNRVERQNKSARKRYCRKGYHKLRSGSVYWKQGKKRKITVNYLKCAHCNYLFFANKKDKERYEKINSRLKIDFSALFKNSSGAKSKHTKALVSLKAGKHRPEKRKVKK